MILDGMIVGAVVSAAVAYLVWRFLPRRKAACASPCAACPSKARLPGRSPEGAKAGRGIPVRGA